MNDSNTRTIARVVVMFIGSFSIIGILGILVFLALIGYQGQRGTRFGRGAPVFTLDTRWDWYRGAGFNA